MRPQRGLACRGQCSSSSASSSSLAFGTSSPFYCAPTSAAAFSSSTPKHTLRKLMSHVNQARSNDRHDDERLRTVGSSSSSLIMIHRHTARLIVYRSFTMPASQPANTPDDVDIYARTIHMHLCTFLLARPFLTFFVISPVFWASRAPSAFFVCITLYWSHTSHLGQLAAFRQARFSIHVPVYLAP